MKALFLSLLLAATAAAESMDELVRKVDRWLAGQGCPVPVQRHESSAVWEHQLVSAQVDISQYIVSPLKPVGQRLETRRVPSPTGFRIEVMLTENAPQILGQHITTRGPERQRYYNRDQNGTVLSTWMWFSKELPLVYNVEFGTTRKPDFAYSLSHLFDGRP